VRKSFSRGPGRLSSGPADLSLPCNGAGYDVVGGTGDVETRDRQLWMRNGRATQKETWRGFVPVGRRCSALRWLLPMCWDIMLPGGLQLALAGPRVPFIIVPLIYGRMERGPWAGQDRQKINGTWWFGTSARLPSSNKPLVVGAGGATDAESSISRPQASRDRSDHWWVSGSRPAGQAFHNGGPPPPPPPPSPGGFSHVLCGPEAPGSSVA